MSKAWIDPEKCVKRYPEALRITREIAREHGYAIAVHGSETRDLDLIAVPWTELASDPVTLIDAIGLAIPAYLTESTAEGEPWPRKKPHGRLCWSLHLGGGPYLDISVMPRNPDSQ